eukprot:1151273-Prymnesium_polylepis.1
MARKWDRTPRAGVPQCGHTWRRGHRTQDCANTCCVRTVVKGCTARHVRTRCGAREAVDGRDRE